jgi:type IV pilus assembly protein PilW
MRNTKQHQKGFSIIELMIAMTLGMMLITAVISIFLSSNKNFSQNDRYARLQENGRFALRLVTKELTMANFWGGMTEPSDIDTTIPLGAQCNLQLDTSNDFLVADNVTASAASTLSGGCVASGTFQPFTDMFVIKHVAGKGYSQTEVANMKPGAPYVITNGSTGRLRVHTPGDATTEPSGTCRFSLVLIPMAINPPICM